MTSTVQLLKSGKLCSRKITIPEYNVAVPGAVIAIQRLPTEAIGTATVSFTGVIVGSEIRVYYSDGQEAAGIETCIANQTLSWQAFSPGAALNTVVIRVVHLNYKLKEFLYSSVVGLQSIPLQQDKDPWFNNPP